MNLSAPRGTQDILPQDIHNWRRLEDALRKVFGRFGYEEIRIPVFEDVRLFNRAVGEVTDIVEKEMYTFASGGEDGDTFALRPELTAGVVRALVEHNLLNNNPFMKLWYAGPAFRKERPQKGRYRQFHQFGVEAIGSMDPYVDAETVLTLTTILKEVGVTQYEIHMNSIGCPNCRPAYREALKQAAAATLKERCGNCQRRFDRNILRLLDCKVEHDRELSKQLPGMFEMLCADCKAHFEKVQSALAGVPFTLDKLLVRGLDYYTKTVYEVTSPLLGSQDALGAGGRYDNLVAELGGPKASGVGFAAGFERVLIAMSHGEAPKPPAMDFFVIYVEDKNKGDAFRILNQFRQAGLSGAMDFESRRMKAQFREAVRANARFAVILGEDEVKKGVVKLKNLTTTEEKEVALDEAVRRLASS